MPSQPLSTEIENRRKYVPDGVEDKYAWSLSLTKLYGREVKDVYVYLSREWGEPFLGVSRIVFTDGSELGVSGEHDVAYIEDYYPHSPKLDIDLNTLIERYPEDED